MSLKEKNLDKQSNIVKDSNKLGLSNCRKIYLGNETEKFNKYNSKYKNNEILTTKYNIFCWLPKSLIVQFLRVANIFFLFICILTLLPVSNKRPGNTIGTFAAVLILSMIKEAYEDIIRYRSDKSVNEKDALVYDYKEKKYNLKKWKNIKVGNIIKVLGNENIPCDMMILKSSFTTGICYLDTMSLDGETSLKEKFTISEIKSLDDEDVINLKGLISCEAPNENLEKWGAHIELENHYCDGSHDNKDNDKLRVNDLYAQLSNIILKGSTLKNTDYVIGIAIYTGSETKIMKNSKPPKIKMSNLMHYMNYILYSLLGFLFTVCFIFAFGFIIWQNTTAETKSFLWKYNKDKVKEYNEMLLTNATIISPILVKKTVNAFSWFKKLLTYHISFCQVIPTSLYVAVEVFKILQSKLVSSDNNMYDEKTKRGVVCRTSDLIEELGQVEFIFTDKTGTLTKNEMMFKKCSINNQIYYAKENESNTNSTNELMKGNNKDNKENNNNNDNNLVKEHKDTDSNNSNNNDNYDSPQILKFISPENPDYKYLSDFFTVCAVCHEAYIENIQNKEIVHSSSPDEIALVYGAKKVGYNFIEKSSGSIKLFVDHLNETQIWKIILVNKFESSRKRMSVIVNKEGTEEYYLFIKGADSQMLSVMKPIEKIETLKKIKEHLSLFAKQALRTLVIGKKKMSKEDVDYLINKNHEISNSFADDKEILINDFYNEVERDFDYIGCSAIEDKLQDDVANTISDFISIDIRVWMLTGDKKETAYEIAKSCALINPEVMFEIDLSSNDDENDSFVEIEEKINKWFYYYYTKAEEGEIQKGNFWTSKNLIQNNINSNKKSFIIIDGNNLSLVLKDPILSKKFFRVGLLSSSVVCCRVSPSQKSQVVKLSKENGKWICLSIGDGENDVPMLNTANIGIGITGKEGSHAARSADYAIGEFKYLKKLLFVHGRWGYRRVAYFMCYYFYKSITMILSEMIFATFSGFSGQIFYPDFLPMLFNKLWTVWPVIFALFMERDVSYEMSEKFPILYKAGHLKYYFNMRVFWKWIANSFVHGFIAYFIGNYSLRYFLSEDGITQDNWFISTMCFSIVVHLVTYKIFVEIKYWNAFNL